MLVEAAKKVPGEFTLSKSVHGNVYVPTSNGNIEFQIPHIQVHELLLDMSRKKSLWQKEMSSKLLLLL